MTSFIIEYVSDPVTRSFEGARTHRPWLRTDQPAERPRADQRREGSSEANGSAERLRASD